MYSDEESLAVKIKKNEDDELYLSLEPDIEHLHKQDLFSLYKYTVRHKPKQVPIGEFQVKECESCNFKGIIHKRQTFCPLCKDILSVIDEDANEEYDEMFQVWQAKKNFIESIVNGKIIEWVNDFNEQRVIDKNEDIEFENMMMGDEVVVDGTIDPI